MRRAGLTIALVVAGAVIAAAAAAWYVARVQPEVVERRIAAQIVDRIAGASVVSIGNGMQRITTSSGVYIDARLSSTFEHCRAERFDCSNAIDRVATDVAQLESTLARPRVADLRAMIIGEPSPGFRYGFLTEPLIGSLEIRYALVAGAASTFVTSTLADRLGVNQAKLRQAALANLAADSEPRAELLADRPGVYRVLSKDDAAAELISPARMRRLAALVGAPRLYCAVPERGVLYLARIDADGKRALLSLLTRGGQARPGDRELLIYDTDAREGQTLAIATAGP